MMVIVDQEGLFVQLTPLRRRVERVGVAARQTSS